MQDVLRELSDILAKGETAVLVTVVATHGSVPRKAGARMLVKQDGSTVGTVGGGSVEHTIKEKAMELMHSGEAQILHFDLSGKEGGTGMICGGQIDAFFEPMVAPETLYMCGAGHIAQATAAIGKMLGFRVVIIDQRPEYNNPERFPDADQLITDDFATAIPSLGIDSKGYIIIYTYAHTRDEECLRLALATGAKYVGMIGSKKKVKEIKERLLASGISQAQLDAVHSPIGLDINAETPEEVAVSILAEIIQVRRAKPESPQACPGSLC
jgi:xanthine dehydrogenase accessory factor